MIDRLVSSWHSPYRPAILGLLLFFCAGFADGAVVPFFPFWARNEGGIPVGAIGLLFGCYAGGELVATPLIGGIADKIGRRPVLIAASIGVGAGFVALFFTHGVIAAAAVLLLTGMFESVLHPTIATVIGDVVPSNDQRRWFSGVSVASSAGHIAGPLVGALLAKSSAGAVFLAAGGVLVLGGALVAALLAETMPAGGTDEDEEEDDESLSALRSAFRDGTLAKLLLWFLLFEISGNWIDSVLPLYASDSGVLSASGVGLLFAYGSGLTVCLQMLVSRIGEKRSALWLTTGVGLASTLGFALLMASNSLPSLIGAVSLCAVAQMLVGPLVPTAINALAPQGQRASYMAASSVAIDLKDTLGPSIGTALYALTPRLPWIAGIPLVALASLGLGTSLGRAKKIN